MDKFGQQFTPEFTIEYFSVGTSSNIGIINDFSFGFNRWAKPEMALQNGEIKRVD